jgi:hypothetical protein
VGAEIVSVTTKVNSADQSDSTDVWVAHLAFAFTLIGPKTDQVFWALVTPTGSHPEFVPSPKSKKYWTGSPKFDLAPVEE